MKSPAIMPHLFKQNSNNCATGTSSLLVYQVASSKKSRAGPCLPGLLAPLTAKLCMEYMPFLQKIQIVLTTLKCYKVYALITCTLDSSSHRVECQHPHGRISPWHRSVNAWRSQMNKSWSSGEVSPVYTPIGV